MRLSSSAGDLPVPFPGTQQTACVVGQILPGGPQEFVLAERTRGPSLVWYRYRDGRFERFVLEPDPLRLEAGGVLFDVDGDGDEDLVLGEDASGDRIYWWENPGPPRVYRPWRRRLVKAGGGRKHHDQAVGDFDGDGRLELAFWNQGQRALCVADVPADPRSGAPWTYRVVYRWGVEDRQHEGLVAADVDRDGRTDLVGAGLWFRSVQGGFERRDIDPQMRFTRALAADLIPGGYLELVFVPGDADGPCVLWHWTGSRWSRRVLEGRVIHGHSLQAGDIDQDGDLDIFLAEMGRWGRNRTNPQARMLLFLNSGRGRFVRRILASGVGNHESKLADVNGDGPLDIVGKPYNWRTPRLEIWINQRDGVGLRLVPELRWRAVCALEPGWRIIPPSEDEARRDRADERAQERLVGVVAKSVTGLLVFLAPAFSLWRGWTRKPFVGRLHLAGNGEGGRGRDAAG